MNLERVEQEEIVTVVGERPMNVRIVREVGQREYNATVKFEDDVNSPVACWHSVNPEEAKKVAIELLLKNKTAESMI